MEFSGLSHFVNTVGALLLVDILLSGDNAMLIAMACRALPPAQRRRAMMIGTVGAIGMRVLMIGVAGALLEIPLLKIVGGLLLVAIALKMLADDHGPHHGAPPGQADTELWAAVGTVITADFIMSLDNVVGLAAVADGNMVALAIGLAMSIPLLMWGSRWVGSMIDRWPLLVPFGAAMLGWIGGSIGVGDPLVSAWVRQQSPALGLVVPALAAVFVLAEGRIMGGSRPRLAALRARIEEVDAARRAAREAQWAETVAAAPQALAASESGAESAPWAISSAASAAAPAPLPVAAAAPSPAASAPASPPDRVPAPALAAPPAPVQLPAQARAAAAADFDARLVVAAAPAATAPAEATPDDTVRGAEPASSPLRRFFGPRVAAACALLFAISMVVLLVMDWKPDPNQLQRYSCLNPKASVEYRPGASVLRLRVGAAYASGTLQPDSQIEWGSYHAVTGVLGIAPPTRVVPDDASTIEIDGGGFAHVQCTLAPNS
ncbi:MAG: TerC family protein [Burkholderiales bacterium]|nr:TerC family protein [Burkholderiales bacterium]